MLKFAIGITAIALLAHFNLIDLALFEKASKHPSLVALSFVLLISTVFIGAYRWKLLLRSLRVRLSFIQAFNYTFIGQFFNVFLPGAYGGDFIRGGLAYRQDKTKLTQIAVSSLVDRLTGLLGLILISLVVVLFLPTQFQQGVAVVAGTGIVIFSLSFFILIRFQNLFRQIINCFPNAISGILMRIFNAVVVNLEHFVDHKRSLIFAVFLSIIQYVIILQALFLIGQAMDIDSLTWTGFAVSGVAGLFANAIPVSPGGLGLGEAAFGQIARFFETHTNEIAYSSVFLFLRSLTLCVAVIGLVPFIIMRDEVKVLTEKNEMEAAEQKN